MPHKSRFTVFVDGRRETFAKLYLALDYCAMMRRQGHSAQVLTRRVLRKLEESTVRNADKQPVGVTPA